MLFDTVAEYDAEITIVRASISRVLQIGHAHTNRSGVSERSTTEIRLDQLRKHLSILVAERGVLAGTGYSGPCLIAPGW